MSTDVVTFRPQRIAARVGTPSRRAEAHGVVPASDRQAPAAMVEIDPAPGLAEAASDRLAAARARWAQLTFYLFDPASWR